MPDTAHTPPAQPVSQSPPSLPATLAPHVAAASRALLPPRLRGAEPRWGLAAEMRAFEAIKASLAAHHDLLDDPDLMLDLAEGETSFLETLDRVLAADLDDEGLIEGLKLMRDTVIARLHRIEERRKSRRVILEQALLALERRTLERPVATLSLSERAPGVEVEDESQIPARYFAMKPVLDRRALKAALEAGESVPGARLSGRLITLNMRRR